MVHRLQQQVDNPLAVDHSVGHFESRRHIPRIILREQSFLPENLVQIGDLDLVTDGSQRIYLVDTGLYFAVQSDLLQHVQNLSIVVCWLSACSMRGVLERGILARKVIVSAESSSEAHGVSEAGFRPLTGFKLVDGLILHHLQVLRLTSGLLNGKFKETPEVVDINCFLVCEVFVELQEPVNFSLLDLLFEPQSVEQAVLEVFFVHETVASGEDGEQVVQTGDSETS